MKDLLAKLKQFDIHYNMSDDPEFYRRQTRLEAEIKTALKTLTPAERQQLAFNIDADLFNHFKL